VFALMWGAVGLASSPAQATLVHARPWSTVTFSNDYRSTATWMYDAATGVVTGTLSDGYAKDAICAVVTVKGFRSGGTWSAASTATVACSAIGARQFRYTWQRPFPITAAVTVCTGTGSCHVSGAAGCLPEYPVKHMWEGPDAQRYQSLITICSDHAETRTTFTNNSDVAWSLTYSNGFNPLVTYPNEPVSNRVFRMTRPDGGTHPLLLRGVTAIAWAAPSSLQWEIEPWLSFAWVPVKTMVEEVVNAGVSASTILVSQKSKGWAAFIGCGKAVYDFAKTTKSAIDGQDISGVVFDTAGAAAGGLGCASLVKAAVRENGGFWPESAGLKKLESVLDNAKWYERITVVDDMIRVFAEATVHL
jgi:hypothetical protein